MFKLRRRKTSNPDKSNQDEADMNFVCLPFDSNGKTEVKLNLSRNSSLDDSSGDDVPSPTSAEKCLSYNTQHQQHQPAQRITSPKPTKSCIRHPNSKGDVQQVPGSQAADDAHQASVPSPKNNDPCSEFRAKEIANGIKRLVQTHSDRQQANSRRSETNQEEVKNPPRNNMMEKKLERIMTSIDKQMNDSVIAQTRSVEKGRMPPQSTAQSTSAKESEEESDNIVLTKSEAEEIANLIKKLSSERSEKVIAMKKIQDEIDKAREMSAAAPPVSQVQVQVQSSANQPFAHLSPSIWKEEKILVDDTCTPMNIEHAELVSKNILQMDKLASEQQGDNIGRMISSDDDNMTIVSEITMDPHLVHNMNRVGRARPPPPPKRRSNLRPPPPPPPPRNGHRPSGASCGQNSHNTSKASASPSAQRKNVGKVPMPPPPFSAEGSKSPTKGGSSFQQSDSCLNIPSRESLSSSEIEKSQSTPVKSSSFVSDQEQDELIPPTLGSNPIEASPVTIMPPSPKATSQEEVTLPSYSPPRPVDSSDSKTMEFIRVKQRSSNSIPRSSSLGSIHEEDEKEDKKEDSNIQGQEDEEKEEGDEEPSKESVIEEMLQIINENRPTATRKQQNVENTPSSMPFNPRDDSNVTTIPLKSSADETNPGSKVTEDTTGRIKSRSRSPYHSRRRSLSQERRRSLSQDDRRGDQSNTDHGEKRMARPDGLAANSPRDDNDVTTIPLKSPRTHQDSKAMNDTNRARSRSPFRQRQRSFHQNDKEHGCHMSPKSFERMIMGRMRSKSLENKSRAAEQQADNLDEYGDHQQQQRRPVVERNGRSSYNENYGPNEHQQQGRGGGDSVRSWGRPKTPVRNSSSAAASRVPEFDKRGCCLRHPFVVVAKKRSLGRGWNLMKGGCQFCIDEQDSSRWEHPCGSDVRNTRPSFNKRVQDHSSGAAEGMQRRETRSVNSSDERYTSPTTSEQRRPYVNRMPYIQPWDKKTGWYTGEVIDGKPHGTGRMRYKDGGNYSGEWKNGYTSWYLESSGLGLVLEHNNKLSAENEGRPPDDTTSRQKEQNLTEENNTKPDSPKKTHVNVRPHHHQRKNSPITMKRIGNMLLSFDGTNAMLLSPDGSAHMLPGDIDPEQAAWQFIREQEQAQASF